MPTSTSTDVSASTDGEVRIARIRTSDRQAFKRCRRRWNWTSNLKQNLDTKFRPSYFWIGTGGHFALEDYHGYNAYGHPIEAFRAYVQAYRKWTSRSNVEHEMPDDWKAQQEMGEAILDYYVTDWLRNRNPYKTLWVNEKPQVELNIEIPLPFTAGQLEYFGYTQVVYGMKLDRLCLDLDNTLWVQDYKFFKNLNIDPLDWDEQMSAYVWGASCIYEQLVEGAIHLQFKKQIAQPPKILTTGRISTDKHQGTTHRLYEQALRQLYGDLSKAPMTNIECLGHFAEIESEDRDAFILRERTRRNLAEQQATGTQIMMEVAEMLDPHLPIYPNHTKDCSWDCQFSSVCQAVDRDDDWAAELEETSTTREEEATGWRALLPNP